MPPQSPPMARRQPDPAAAGPKEELVLAAPAPPEATDRELMANIDRNTAIVAGQLQQLVHDLEGFGKSLPPFMRPR